VVVVQLKDHDLFYTCMRTCMCMYIVMCESMNGWQSRAGHNWLNQGGTIIDAMSTLAVMGEVEEFKRAAGPSDAFMLRMCTYAL
jgi:hypothetical protein